MPVEKQGDIPWYEWPLRWLGAFVNAVIPSITAYAPGPEDPEVQKYHAKKRLELKPGDKVPDSEDETRKIVKEKFRNDSKKWLESIPRNVKLPELPKEPDWNSIGWDKLKGTDPETTILRRWILSKFIDYKNSKYYNPKALSPETLKQIELIETKELDRIAHELYSQVSRKDEKYDPFNWNTIGSLILMCGGGLVIKLAGAGVITLETAIGIMAGGGAAVGGGTELANQVQSGGAINPGAVATRTAFGGVKGALWGFAPELGSVGFGASIGGYSAVENLTYNATKGKTTASDSIEAIAGGLGEGLFAGIVHKASSKASGKASESTPAKPEPIKQMTEAELEKVSGGAKDPGWRPQSILKPIMKTIHGEERNIAVHAGKQGKHIVGHNNYENALKQGKTPSILYGTEEDAQRLVNEFAGKGQIVKPDQERINFGKTIGKYIDQETGTCLETTNGTIRYSKDGVHIVPSNPDMH